MPKICLVGAGSTVFAQNILGDVLSSQTQGAYVISLFDIDPERLKTSEIVARRICEALGRSSVKIEATLDRRDALRGSDFVILMMQVGGYKPATVTDFDVPKKYGLRQTIADTLGIGGIFRGLRTIPVLEAICRDMQDVCPQALLMQYVNPMAINCWAINELAPEIRTVGLCHSVQHTAAHLAKCLDEDVADVNYVSAGINHVAFFLKYEKVHRDGRREDLYPRLKALAVEGRVPVDDRVRFDVLQRLGHFVTESSEHFSEYTSWYIKEGRNDLIDRLNIPLDEYLRRCDVQIGEWRALRQELEGERPIEVCRSNEYAAGIIHAAVTGTPALIYGNVANNGLIENLPADCIVEVPCHVDRNGVQPVRIGRIPSQLAAVMNLSISVQRLTVEAALTKSRERIYQAALLDPHTSAELSPDQIWSMVDDLIDAHGDLLPQYQ
ncbi:MULTISPECIES: alpha-glucosidase/alpha-galactosidase [unclassified Rhizobium]|uniref:alpha-glucosidase/alpha-galactosidase n=1 Tax=unclassified Rhizobium TaxID=2613769 RepID=UPI001A98A937|nr:MULTISPECIES: alpha-glucosidase/alpha-galactosidase [unclassified Rhizobium]MBX5174624.1 alpha-glucosidase/alpha-galactosidase [Rhizobium sp. NZLR1b]MBX5181387.1 alpha-glucosidase/alpha-galactosidase [Rhizobium sp. NZLR5]MBX5199339.1 alpha-glucosidase/alpha-galactosidase [Rhizobium sp. NZLR10]MBX5200747.1 alpha-glucosidase/alpha-galactosidase [Rhizobium sp. NZLR1]QSZ24893.1 alpha-glucosidase/alpha-galactosidase [Rhizobium sp. NZLR1]